MRTVLPLVCVVLLACKGGEDPVTDTSTLPTDTAIGTSTGTSTPVATTSATGDLTGACVQQSGNVLRWDCTFGAASATSLDVSWTPAAGGPSRSATSASGTDHTITLWGMRAETAMEFTATGAGGTVNGSFTTAALPAEVATSATVSGSSAMDGFLAGLGCADATGVGIFDGDGQLIWYQTYAGTGGVGGGGIGGYHFTPQGTVLVFVGDEITEHTLQGEQILSLSRGSDFGDDPLHHDIFRSVNGLTYVLTAESVNQGGTDYVLDKVLILDAGGTVDEWALSAVVTPSGGGQIGGFWSSVFPNAVDYSHGNSIWVGDDGVGYISLRHQNAVLAVQLDPGHLDFGELLWTLTGSTSDLTGTVVLAGEEFIGQHNFNPFSDGSFGLFDNHIEGGGPGAVGDSRGAVLDLDIAGGTATMTETYEVGTACSAQGAMYETADGNRLVTCATSQLVQEFAPGGGSPVFSWDMTCDGGGGGPGGGGGGGLLARAMPVSL